MRMVQWRTLPPTEGDVGQIDTVVCKQCRDNHTGQPDGYFLAWVAPATDPWILCYSCGVYVPGRCLDHVFPDGPPAKPREATPEEYAELGIHDPRGDAPTVEASKHDLATSGAAQRERIPTASGRRDGKSGIVRGTGIRVPSPTGKPREPAADDMASLAQTPRRKRRLNSAMMSFVAALLLGSGGNDDNR